MNRGKRRINFARLVVIICLSGVGMVLPNLAKAEVSVMVNNETGYDLGEVKYVQEAGEVKSLAGRTRQLSNGGYYTFRLQKEGAYRIYTSLIMGGKTVYAKGNANNLRTGGRYTLTLKKVVVSQGGSSIRFINQSEFEAIK